MKNAVITIARQYGSGGKTIAAMLAKDLGINCYGREILKMASEESGINERLFGMSDEKLKHSVLMDEPSMGLSPILVNEIFDIIQEVSKSGTTVLLVEQNAKKALSIADRAYVLETGRIALEGRAEDLLRDDSIKKAYLGE